MSHHYLHVNPDVKHHLGNQLPSEGWLELIVSDLTENGKQLSAVVLPRNEFGPQIALYGDRFYAGGFFRTREAQVVRLVEIQRGEDQPMVGLVAIRSEEIRVKPEPGR